MMKRTPNLQFTDLLQFLEYEKAKIQYTPTPLNNLMVWIFGQKVHLNV